MSANSFNIPRHWWGKIIGGVIGLFRGGIVGAVVGAILGHLVDRFLAGILNVGKTQKAFFDALFASLGALAKADGQVTQAEIQMVESLMQQMRISGDDRQRAIRLFNQGKQAAFPLDDVLAQFKQECHRRTSLVQMFIEIPFATALSDGKVDAGEKQVLYRIGEILDFSREQIDHLFNIASGAKPSADDTLTLSQAYKILGVEKESSDAKLPASMAITSSINSDTNFFLFDSALCAPRNLTFTASTQYLWVWQHRFLKNLCG